MEIIVSSRGMKATDILDLAYEIGLERPHIATAGEWDGGRVHILTYGPLSRRKTLEIAAPAKSEQVEKQLRTALVSVEAKKLDEPPFVPPGQPTAKAFEPYVEKLVSEAPIKPKGKRASKAAH